MICLLLAYELGGRVWWPSREESRMSLGCRLYGRISYHCYPLFTVLSLSVLNTLGAGWGVRLCGPGAESPVDLDGEEEQQATLHLFPAVFF